MIAVVTDSTACLPDELIRQHDITVVRLHLLVGGESLIEGVDVEEAEVARILGERRAVTTSKPSAGDFLSVYRGLAESGADQILSIHISSRMSGTLGSAEVAAAEAGVPVTILDSRSLGMGLGFAVVSAAEAVAAGASAPDAAEVARQRAANAHTTFYVDSLEHLRRGGRIGRASALVGSALAMKPLLTLRDGEVGALEKVRTSNKALARLEKHTIGHARTYVDRGEGVDVAVQHLDAGKRAEGLRDRIQQELGGAVEVRLVGLGAVVAAHVGPGTIGAVVSPHPTRV